VFPYDKFEGTELGQKYRSAQSPLQRLMVVGGKSYTPAALLPGNNTLTYFTRNCLVPKAGLVPT